MKDLFPQEETKTLEFELPRTLGQYRLVKHLGSGGMGSVFRATSETSHETVAIKLLRVPVGRTVSVELLARFRQEAEFLAHAKHPNIVQFVDFGTVGRELFLAMEFVEGVTLRSHLRRHGSLGAKEFLDIAIQLADVIQCLQGYGLLHRDLKPQNIMLTADLGMDRVKVLDFGLSALSPEIQGVVPDETVMMGTVTYAAPEQTGYIEGRVDARTDLYSLGCVFYEMLIGEPPFLGSDPEHVTFLHLSSEPKNVCELRPEIPRPLGAIISKLLQKNPDDRYQTGYGLLHDLKECRRQVDASGDWELSLGSHDHFQGLHFGSKTIGRERHFAALSKSVALAKSGTAHAVVMTGELGIGKSWLLSEFRVRSIEERVTFITARLQKMAFDCGLQPICGMLDSYFLQLLRYSPSRRKRVLEKLAPALVESVVPLLQSIPSTREMIAQLVERDESLMEQVAYNVESRRRHASDGSTDPALSGALVRVICEISRIEECLVVDLDNIHWADSDVFRFLDELLATATAMESRLLLILSVNRENIPGFEECHRLVHKLRQKAVYVHQVNLAPFNVDEVEQFIRTIIVDESSVVARLSQRLHSFTQGNPLFLREVLKSMAANDFITFDPVSRKWKCSSDELSGLGLPTDVVDLIIERTKPFSSQVRMILAAAARIGLCFTREFLSDLFPGWMIAVRDALDDAAREHLISGRDGKYWFTHARIREYFLASISDDDAADVHLRIFNRIRHQNCEEFVACLREYAHHAYCARKRLDAELVCTACAELALAEDNLGDVQRSQEQLTRAIDVASGTSTPSLRAAIPILQIRLAEALRRLGQTGRALRLLDDVATTIGGNLANSPMDHFFLVSVAHLRLLLLQGESPVLRDSQRQLVEIALSMLQSILDSNQLRGVRSLPLDVAETIAKLDAVAHLTQVVAAVSLLEQGGGKLEPEILSVEQRLGRRLSSPQGLTEMFLADEERLSWVVQFLLIAALSERNPTIVALLEKAWSTSRAAFLGIHPDVLWVIWMHEFTEISELTRLQVVSRESLEELALGEDSRALTARMYVKCIRLYTEWKGLSTADLHRNLDELKSIVVDVRGLGQPFPSVWGLLLIASFRFLFGDWSEISKCVEDAVAEAEHLDCPGLLDECYSLQAALVAFRDEARMERCLDRMTASPAPRRVLLRRVALSLNAFALKPLEALVDSPLGWQAAPSQWLRGHPVLVFAGFLSLCTRVAASSDSRAGHTQSLPVLFQRYRQELDSILPKETELGFSALFRSTVLLGLELGLSPDEDARRRFYNSEIQANNAKSTTWLVFSRLLLFRLKRVEAEIRGSQFLHDEAGMHLSLASRHCDESGFHRLSTAIESISGHSTESVELGTTGSPSRSRDLSSLLGRLKLDRVFLYSSALLGKQSLEELAQGALEALVELTGAQRGAIFIRDRISTTFFLKSLFGLSLDEGQVDPVVIEAVGDSPQNLPLSWSVLTKVRMEGRLVAVHNAQTDDSMANQFSVVRNRIRSVLGVPLVHRDELVGIVYLDSCLLNDLFTRETVKLIQPVIKQVGFCISNIWLQKSSEESFLALKESQKSLVQSEKMAGLGQLAASVAHDLRTPLAIVRGLAEDMGEWIHEGDTLAVTDAAERIVTAAKKMQRLVDSMQAFSRKSSREKRPTSLRKVLDEVLFLTEKRVVSCGVELTLQLPADLPDILGNENELEQIFMNLVNNALDAMEESPKKQLGIMAHQDHDGSVWVNVRDSGCGIAPEDHRHVFQPFFTTKVEGRGTGLGLSIVNSLVREQSGCISFESVVGEGTNFLVGLPSVDRAGNVRGLRGPSTGEAPAHAFSIRK